MVFMVDNVETVVYNLLCLSVILLYQPAKTFEITIGVIMSLSKVTL
jgi:hypothetical protein